MQPARTFRLALDIDSVFPNLHPPAVPLARKARAGELKDTGWRTQMHAELDAMLDQVAAERQAAKKRVEPLKRKGRYYD